MFTFAYILTGMTIFMKAKLNTKYREALILKMCSVINIIKWGEIIFIQKNC